MQKLIVDKSVQVEKGGGARSENEKGKDSIVMRWVSSAVSMDGLDEDCKPTSRPERRRLRRPAESSAGP